MHRIPGADDIADCLELVLGNGDFAQKVRVNVVEKEAEFSKRYGWEVHYIENGREFDPAVWILLLVFEILLGNNQKTVDSCYESKLGFT